MVVAVDLAELHPGSAPQPGYPTGDPLVLEIDIDVLQVRLTFGAGLPSRVPEPTSSPPLSPAGFGWGCRLQFILQHVPM